MTERRVIYNEGGPRTAASADLGWGTLYVYQHSAMLEVPTEAPWEEPPSAGSYLDVAQLKDLAAAATWAAEHLAAQVAEFNPLGGAAKGIGRCVCAAGPGTNPACQVHP